MRRLTHIVLVLATVVLFHGCGIYSFSGASIPAEAKTVSVQYFPNQAFEGEITDYRTTPVAITSGQTAALNRLTITVNVRFTNMFDDTKNFETKFSHYEDYPSDQDLNAVQELLTPTIIEALVEDVFNKALVNW